jgi:hypothetical protein
VDTLAAAAIPAVVVGIPVVVVVTAAVGIAKYEIGT